MWLSVPLIRWRCNSPIQYLQQFCFCDYIFSYHFYHTATVWFSIFLPPCCLKIFTSSASSHPIINSSSASPLPNYLNAINPIILSNFATLLPNNFQTVLRCPLFRAVLPFPYLNSGLWFLVYIIIISTTQLEMRAFDEDNTFRDCMKDKKGIV